MADAKETLVRYLTRPRDSLVWKLQGLSEYDVRRPMTPTGTNLLGLVKHVGSVAVGYFGETFDRPFPDPVPWLDDGSDDGRDMYAAEDETRADILDFYERAWAHSMRTIEELDLDAVGHVPWWAPARSEVTLQQILVHMIAEADHHAGHADIVRELIDGAAGIREGMSNLPDESPQWWSDYVTKLEAIARAASQ